jgi:AcrR family transcriptional regulator
LDTLFPEDEDPGRKQTQILNGAAAIFAQDGYDGASMSRIAAEAGVSKGTLYNYFPSKADLFIATVRRDCSNWIELVFDEIDTSASAETTLRSVGLQMIGLLVSDPALTMFRMVIAEAEKFPELAEAFYKAGPARAIAHLSAYLGGACARGELAIPDRDFAAEQFYALMQTHLIVKRRLRLIAMPDRTEMARIVDSAVAMFLNTYGIAGQAASNGA